MTTSKLNTIDEALQALQAGKPIIVVDDEDRENEGDLVVAAQFATAKMINFMAQHARGLICVALPGSTLDRLKIPMMVSQDGNSSAFASPFTVSVEARTGVTTGISASDRARTIQGLINPESTAEDIAMPGHIFPLRAHPDGVLARRGHTEAGVELTRLAGLQPAAVLCEIMSPDGTMARLPELTRFAARHDLPIITIEALVNRVLQQREDHIIRRVASSALPTRYGHFTATAYSDARGREHLSLNYGPLPEAPLVRLHSECLTGDALGSLRCDCGEQLQSAMQRIAENGSGLILYLRQEGRGIGLANKIQAYALQDDGLDTVQANLCLGFLPDQRDYAVAAAMLREQGISTVRLLSNNPEKVRALQECGITVVERVAHEVPARPENHFYLQTKAEKMQHALHLDTDEMESKPTARLAGCAGNE